MDVLSTILITLVITLLSMVLLVPIAWRGAKFLSSIVESVAKFLYRLRNSIRDVFGAFKRNSTEKLNR